MYDIKFAIILSDSNNLSSAYAVTSSPPADYFQNYHQRGSHNPVSSQLLCRVHWSNVCFFSNIH